MPVIARLIEAKTLDRTALHAQMEFRRWWAKRQRELAEQAEAQEPTSRETTNEAVDSTSDAPTLAGAEPTAVLADSQQSLATPERSAGLGVGDVAIAVDTSAEALVSSDSSSGAPDAFTAPATEEPPKEPTLNLTAIFLRVEQHLARHPEIADICALRGLSPKETRLAVAHELYGDRLFQSIEVPGAPQPPVKSTAPAVPTSPKTAKEKAAQVWKTPASAARSAGSSAKPVKPAKRGAPSPARCAPPSSQPISPKILPLRPRASAR